MCASCAKFRRFKIQYKLHLVSRLTWEVQPRAYLWMTKLVKGDCLLGTGVFVSLVLNREYLTRSSEQM